MRVWSERPFLKEMEMSKVGRKFEEMDEQVELGSWSDAYGTTSSTL